MSEPLPETAYAPTAGGYVGYQVWGGSGPDLLEFPNGTVISIDETAEEPHWLAYESRLASFSRLIRFDHLGLGLSDPLAPGTAPTTEQMVETACAVLDAAGSEQTVLLGAGGGAQPALLLAATRPERVTGLVLLNGTARVGWAEDYPVGIDPELMTLATAGGPSLSVGPDDAQLDDAHVLVPSLADRPGFRDWWSRAARRGASPTTSQGFNLLFFTADVRPCLGQIRCPTLIVSRRDVFAGAGNHGTYLAEHIEGSRHVTVPGRDILPYAGDFGLLLDEVEEFMTGRRPSPEPERALATLLFTDIVASTERAALVGDRAWRAMLEDMDRAGRTLVERHGGRHVKDTGDGLLARFDLPAPAVRCALALVAAGDQLDLPLRAGLHTGEVELRGAGDVGGIAVHLAARVLDRADEGEVLVTGTVRDLVTGSGLEFKDRGRHPLRGVPDEWQLYEAVGG
jgi:class 3 adenylate cyclase